MDAVEDIKQRLSIEDVVAEYVELKRSGRNYKGLSPFTSERTPSFMVSPEKQIWHDFSSGRGGDMFTFVMEVEGLDFKGALEYLARKAGVDLALYEKGTGTARKKKDAAQAALALAVRYYQQCLLKNNQAIDYVTKKRQLRRQTIADFAIGYSPNSGHALSDALQKKDITADTMRSAGLATERYGRVGDMFRGRIMIPLLDAQGEPLGFTARLLDANDNGPKYINTPQTILYDKSRHVFGLHTAKDAIRSAGYVVIVEGNMDVISAHQAGYKHVVATAGTAMTTYQLKALQRLTNDIRLCFDQDAAGIAAAERAIDVAQGVGVQLGIVSLPMGKDPDELIHKDVSLWEAAIAQPQYAVDWLIARYREKFDIATVSGKKQFSNTLARVVGRLKDSVEQDHYISVLATIADVSPAAIHTKLRVMANTEHTPLKQAKIAVDTINQYQDEYQDRLLALLVVFPLTRRVLETADTSAFVFSSPERQRVFEYVSQNPHATISEAVPEDLKDVEDYVKILVLKAEELYAVGFDANDRLRELQDLITKLKTKYFALRRQELSERIKQAEVAGDESLVNKLLAEFNTVLKKEKG